MVPTEYSVISLRVRTIDSNSLEKLIVLAVDLYNKNPVLEPMASRVPTGEDQRMFLYACYKRQICY